MIKEVLLFSFLLLISGYAIADRVDEMNKLKPVAYCAESTRLYHTGIFARNLNVEKVIKEIPKELMSRLQRGEQVTVPTDAIYLTEWENMNDREKAFVQDLVFKGYETGDEMIQHAIKVLETLPENNEYVGKVGAVLTATHMDMAAQAYFERCLKERVEKGQMRKIQGEHFRDQGKMGRLKCETVVEDSIIISEAVGHQWTTDEIREVANAANNISEGRKAQISKMLDHLDTWELSLEEWRAHWAASCGDPI